MSVDLSWTVDEVDGVRFVACRVHNEADVVRRVRIDSLLSGPVLPPRRSGVPEAGWDRDGVTLRLDADERRGVGFASPAPATDPPVEIAEFESLAGEDAEPESDTTAEAIRTLGEHRPPGEAVATDASVSLESADSLDFGTDVPSEHGRAAFDGGATTNPTRSSMPDRLADPVSENAGSDAPGPEDAGSEDAGSTHLDPSALDPNALDPNALDPTSACSTSPDPADSSVRSSRSEHDRTAIGPDRIDDWFDAVERRIERAERLTDGDLDSATEAVAALGGTNAVADLDRRVSDDAVRLRRVSDRAAALARRAEETDAPVEALERLA